jgi:hypothetical protein
MACCRKAASLRAKRLKEARQIKVSSSRNTDWSEVRKKLVGTWIKEPQWACGQLTEYFGSIKKGTTEKLRIVLNYLRSEKLGNGQITHSCINTMRTQISMELKRRDAK